jgi:hypothetical protein
VGQAQAHGQVRRHRRSGATRLVRLAAAAGAAAMVWAPAVPVAATDDNDDLKDKLVDDVEHFALLPPGDPLEGRSGPVDWGELGPAAGVDTRIFPDDMRAYVNSFVGGDGIALVVGIQADDLDPHEMVLGAEISLGDGEALTLPQADAAQVDYAAYRVTPPDMPGDADMTLSLAVLADEDIAVMVIVNPLDLTVDDQAEAETQRATLDTFVTAQAQFRPPTAGNGNMNDRIGDGLPPAAGPLGDGGVGSSGVRQAGAIVSVTLLTLGTLLLIRYLWLPRRPVPVAATGRWASPPGGFAGGRGPSGPAAAAWSRPFGPQAAGPAGPPVAPPPVPLGGFRTGRATPPLPPAPTPPVALGPAVPPAPPPPPAVRRPLPPPPPRPPARPPAPAPPPATRSGWTLPG